MNLVTNIESLLGQIYFLMISLLMTSNMFYKCGILRGKKNLGQLDLLFIEVLMLVSWCMMLAQKNLFKALIIGEMNL